MYMEGPYLPQSHTANSRFEVKLTITMSEGRFGIKNELYAKQLNHAGTPVAFMSSYKAHLTELYRYPDRVGGSSRGRGSNHT